MKKTKHKHAQRPNDKSINRQIHKNNNNYYYIQHISSIFLHSDLMKKQNKVITTEKTTLIIQIYSGQRFEY